MSLENRKHVALEDPGAEVLDRVGHFWERYSRIVLGAAAAIVVVGVLGFFMMRSRAAAEEQASGRLAEATLMFWQGDYQRSLETAREVARQYASTPSGADAHRLAGDNAYWLTDYRTAVEEYRQYLAKKPNGMLADAARRSFAYALESAGQHAEAAAEYDRLVGRFDRESSAEFLAASARCLSAAGQPAEAARRLQRLLDEFGETSYANRARIDLGAQQAPAR